MLLVRARAFTDTAFLRLFPQSYRKGLNSGKLGPVIKILMRRQINLNKIITIEEQNARVFQFQGFAAHPDIIMKVP